MTKERTPIAIRYDVSGLTGRYIDAGSGSDWMLRGMKHPDATKLYEDPPEILEIIDKLEGAQAELDEAIEVAFRWGARDWVFQNFPKRYDDLKERYPAPLEGGAPFRKQDLDRGLVLFRTSSNAHGTVNFVSITEKVNALSQASKDELANMMRNFANGLSMVPQPVDDHCPDCGRAKAKNAQDAEDGMCPKWWAIMDKDAEEDCKRRSTKDTGGVVEIMGFVHQNRPDAQGIHAEIERLRPHYQTNSALDQGRRQMLDHFASMIVKPVKRASIRTLAEENVRLREALAWYGEQARLARLIHSQGDAGRHALAGDGGKRANEAIASTTDILGDVERISLERAAETADTMPGYMQPRDVAKAIRALPSAGEKLREVYANGKALTSPRVGDEVAKAVQFLLWQYDRKGPIAECHEAWEVLRAANLIEQQAAAQAPSGWTGSGSLEALKLGGEGYIYATKTEAHPIAIFTSPQKTDHGVLQDDLKELLQILGMDDGARPQSPHEVFQEAIGVLRQRLSSLYEGTNVLHEALEALVTEVVDYMTINKLGDPEKQHNVKVARAAIASSLAGEPSPLMSKMLGLIRWAHDTLYEINPSNYDHEEVMKLNAASVEVILGLAPIIGEKHGKTQEWWDARGSSPENRRVSMGSRVLPGAELEEFCQEMRDTYDWKRPLDPRSFLKKAADLIERQSEELHDLRDSEGKYRMYHRLEKDHRKRQQARADVAELALSGLTTQEPLGHIWEQDIRKLMSGEKPAANIWPTAGDNYVPVFTSPRLSPDVQKITVERDEALARLGSMTTNYVQCRERERQQRDRAEVAETETARLMTELESTKAAAVSHFLNKTEVERELHDAKKLLDSAQNELKEALQAVDAFADVCDELGCERDNEAGLAAAAKLKEDLKVARRDATDRSYMIQTYFDLLGPKALALAKRWKEMGVLRQHTSWGPNAASMTGEERAQVLIDIQNQVDNSIPVEDLDGDRVSQNEESDHQTGLPITDDRQFGDGWLAQVLRENEKEVAAWPIGIRESYESLFPKTTEALSVSVDRLVHRLRSSFTGEDVRHAANLIEWLMANKRRLGIEIIGVTEQSLARLSRARKAEAQVVRTGSAQTMRDIIGTVLTSELRGSYDCERVWEAWSFGTMTHEDFKPVEDRIDDIIEAVAQGLGSATDEGNFGVARMGAHFKIEHDGFAGVVIGDYRRLDGKRGVVLQQDGTLVCHVYGEKWIEGQKG